jgi:hypothetical protein
MNQRVGGLCTGFICSCPGALLKLSVAVSIESAAWLAMRRNRARGCREEGGEFSYNAVRLEKFVPAGYSPSLRNSGWRRASNVGTDVQFSQTPGSEGAMSAILDILFARL